MQKLFAKFGAVLDVLHGWKYIFKKLAKKEIDGG